MKNLILYTLFKTTAPFSTLLKGASGEGVLLEIIENMSNGNLLELRSLWDFFLGDRCLLECRGDFSLDELLDRLRYLLLLGLTRLRWGVMQSQNRSKLEKRNNLFEYVEKVNRKVRF